MMTTTVNLQISLESLIQAVSTPEFNAKKQLLDVIEQQIFEAEEEMYQEDPDTMAEIEAVQAECENGELTTVDDFIQRQSV